MDFFTKFFREQKKNSGGVAKERLMIVLAHDRATISPEILRKMSDEIIEVISKYFEVERDEIEINLNREDENMALVTNIPVKQMHRV
jgi:cell division topological specificity factor